MNTEELLGKLAEMRRSIPYLSERPRPENKSLLDARTVEEFETAAVVDALETLADDVRATIEETTQRAYENALDVYYAAEELARDPQNAHIVPHVEAMRAAHQKSYGKPIPTKEETEERRNGRNEARRRKGGPGTAASPHIEL